MYPRVMLYPSGGQLLEEGVYVCVFMCIFVLNWTLLRNPTL